jgi:hypothetical protein
VPMPKALDGVGFRPGAGSLARGRRSMRATRLKRADIVRTDPVRRRGGWQQQSALG